MLYVFHRNTSNKSSSPDSASRNPCNASLTPSKILGSAVRSSQTDHNSITSPGSSLNPTMNLHISSPSRKPSSPRQNNPEIDSKFVNFKSGHPPSSGSANTSLTTNSRTLNENQDQVRVYTHVQSKSKSKP